MNRGADSNGRAASTAGLNRSVWPTASVAPRARASATRASASASDRASGFSMSTAVPASRNGDRHRRVRRRRRRHDDGIHDAGQRGRIGDHRRAVRVGNLPRALLVGIDDAHQVDAWHRGQDPRVMTAQMADADDRYSHVRALIARPRVPTMAIPAASAASITAWPSTSSVLPASIDSAVAPMSRITSTVRRRRPARRTACPGSAWRPSPCARRRRPRARPVAASRLSLPSPRPRRPPRPSPRSTARRRAPAIASAMR